MDIEVNFGAGDFTSDVILSKGTSSSKALMDRPLSNVSFIGFTRSSGESCSSQTYVLDSSSILDTSYNSLHGNNNDGLLLDSRLQSELELKTESLKERLNEIQILQTQLQTVTTALQGKESELAGAKGENKRLSLEVEQLGEKLSEEKEVKEQLEFRLREIEMNAAGQNIVEELKEEVRKLEETLLEKAEWIGALEREIECLRGEVKSAEAEKKTAVKREEEFTDSFVKVRNV
jgi:chromosome segregation ATPase